MAGMQLQPAFGKLWEDTRGDQATAALVNTEPGSKRSTVHAPA